MMAGREMKLLIQLRTFMVSSFSAEAQTHATSNATPARPAPLLVAGAAATGCRDLDDTTNTNSAVNAHTQPCHAQNSGFQGTNTV